MSKTESPPPETRALGTTPTEAPPVESQAAALGLAERLADQVDHCLLGYAISRQNSISIEEAMLQLRVACNDFRAALAAEGSAETKS